MKLFTPRKLIFVVAFVLLAGLPIVATMNGTINLTAPQVDLHTIEYDGHKWVWAEGHRKGGLEHHPDCPCLNETL